MANRLGPMWLNRVTQMTGPTSTGRFSRFALLAQRVNQHGADSRAPHR